MSEIQTETSLVVLKCNIRYAIGFILLWINTHTYNKASFKKTTDTENVLFLPK